MSKKLYVGNLSYDTTSETLRDAFAKAGEVEDAFVLTDKMTGRSRGFGFVTMVNDEGAAAAIEMYNGNEIDSRKVVVNEARPMTERPAGGSRGGFNRRGGRSDYGGGGQDY